MHEPVEYIIQLNTGETLQITEIDSGLWPELRNHKIREHIQPLLDRCTSCSREVAEDAKRGYSKPLEALLRTPPEGCLLKIHQPVCREIRSCISANHEICKTHSRKPRNRPLPICWTYDPGADNETGIMASAIGTIIIHAWNEGRYVLWIDD